MNLYSKHLNMTLIHTFILVSLNYLCLRALFKGPDAPTWCGLNQHPSLAHLRPDALITRLQLDLQ